MVHGAPPQMFLQILWDSDQRPICGSRHFFAPQTFRPQRVSASVALRGQMLEGPAGWHLLKLKNIPVMWFLSVHVHRLIPCPNPRVDAFNGARLGRSQVSWDVLAEKFGFRNPKFLHVYDMMPF